MGVQVLREKHICGGSSISGVLKLREQQWATKKQTVRKKQEAPNLSRSKVGIKKLHVAEFESAVLEEFKKEVSILTYKF